MALFQDKEFDIFAQITMSIAGRPFRQKDALAGNMRCNLQRMCSLVHQLAAGWYARISLLESFSFGRENMANRMFLSMMLTVLLAAPTVARATPFSGIYVFGDSL